MMVKQIKPDGRSPKVVKFTSGIYSIVHFPTMRRYVGSSQEVEKRLYLHRVMLNRGGHHCKYLQNVWTKYGEDAFKFFLLEECKICNLEPREQFHMDKKSKFSLMNTHPAAGSARGFKMSDKSKRKMRKKAWQVSNTPEQKLMRSERAKRQHLLGELGRKKHETRVRICKKCQTQFNQLRNEIGNFSQTKYCEECRPKHFGGRYKRLVNPNNLGHLPRQCRDCGICIPKTNHAKLCQACWTTSKVATAKQNGSKNAGNTYDGAHWTQVDDKKAGQASASHARSFIS